MSEKTFVIVGRANTKGHYLKNTIMFMGIDSHSGGYPYWTTSIFSAHHFTGDPIKEIEHNVKFLDREINAIGYAEIKIDIVSMNDLSQVDAYVKAKKREAISEQIAKLEAELKELG